ncbi:MAG: hypothetical protein AB8G22_24230, partial [Saprospiraceae bacterium]
MNTESIISTIRQFIPFNEEAFQIFIEIHDRTHSFLVDSPEERYYKLLAKKPDLFNRIPQYYIA